MDDPPATYKIITAAPLLWRLYRGENISDVKGFGWFVLKIALPPFSPPHPSGVQISKLNMH